MFYEPLVSYGFHTIIQCVQARLTLYIFDSMDGDKNLAKLACAILVEGNSNYFKAAGETGAKCIIT